MTESMNLEISATKIVGIEMDDAEDVILRDPEVYLSSNSLRILHQYSRFHLPQIRSMVRHGKFINLKPEYQRRQRWSVEQKSEFIESFIINVPIPSVYLYEDDSISYEVMDGRQRLIAIDDFLSGEFKLTGLNFLSLLNGKSYSELTPRVKRTIDRSSINAVVLLMDSEANCQNSENVNDVDLKKVIFEKLNTGSSARKHQELRNALYPGVFNDTLVELSQYQKFTEVFSINPFNPSQNGDFEDSDRYECTFYKQLKDCELILRYFALRDFSNIKGTMKSMLDRAMRIEFDSRQAKESKENFKKLFEFLYELFEGKPFRIPDNSNRISANLYDSTMVALNDLWSFKDEIQMDKSSVFTRLKDTLAVEDNLRLMTGEVGDADAIRNRINMMKEVLYPKEHE